MHPRDAVDEALRLHGQGWTDKAVAQACGISVWTIRHWIHGRRRAPSTEARRTQRTTYCPVCGSGQLNAEAYAYLLGLYLGDGHITESRREVHYLWVFCDDKYPGLIKLCSAAMADVLPTSVFHAKRTGCTAVKSASKHWPCLFPQHGPGMKHSRLIELHEWQTKIIDAHPESFLRGLFHSDGCRVVNRVRRKVKGEWKYYEYPRYFLSNTSEDIIAYAQYSLDGLGIRWSFRWAIPAKAHYKPPGHLSVAEKNSVALMDSFIGPKH